MRWFARFGIIVFCFLLWAGLWRGVMAIETGTAAPVSRNSFCFPEFLPGAEMYAWSLTQDLRGNTVLLVQNICEHTLYEVKILFRANGNDLCFEAECVLPGEKAFIEEANETPFANWQTVTCIAYTAKEAEITSSADREDYSCK